MCVVPTVRDTLDTAETVLKELRVVNSLLNLVHSVLKAIHHLYWALDFLNVIDYIKIIGHEFYLPKISLQFHFE